MRARHPTWFKEDLERLFGLLATRAIQPRIAERISFDKVAGAHRRLEAGGLDGKLVLCPELRPPRDRVASARDGHGFQGGAAGIAQVHPPAHTPILISLRSRLAQEAYIALQQNDDA